MSTSKKAEDQLRLFTDDQLEVYEKGKDELTLAEFPLGLAGKDPTRKGKTAVSYQDLIRDSSTGAPITRTVTIQGSEEFGLPTYYDEEILFGVLQLTNLHRTGDEWPKQVRFSRYHLAKILGLKTDGRTYRRIWDSLHRLANTTYNFRFSFFDKQDEEWRPSVVITFIQTLVVHGGPIPGKNGEVTIRWNDDIHRNFQAGYLRNINFTEYRAIGLPLAKALYRYLGKHFHRRSRLKFDLKVFAYEKLGLSRAHNVGQIKAALAPAIERLENHGFIKPASKSERYKKMGVGRWDIIFEKMTPQTSFPMEVSPATVAEAKLIELGVSPGVASQLVTEFPEEVIDRKIDEFNFAVARGKGPERNPGGWLAKSIRESWNPPEDYKTPEEREAAEREREAKETAKKQAAQEKRMKEVQLAQVQAIRNEWIRKVKSSMPHDELEALKEKVIAEQGGDEFAQQLWVPLVEAHIAEVLEREGKIPKLPADDPK
ncbi:replication initiator protein A [Haloferula sargassicola]